jgi:hypothetical protein
MNHVHLRTSPSCYSAQNAAAWLGRWSLSLLLGLLLCWTTWQTAQAQSYPSVKLTTMAMACAEKMAFAADGSQVCSHDEPSPSESDVSDSDILPLWGQSLTVHTVMTRFALLVSARELRHSPLLKPPRHFA